MRYALEKRYMHSCRDNYLRACAHDRRLSKSDIAANINFFMNVPVTSEGAHIRGRHFRARQICRSARGNGRDRADLELPATEQSVQRVQPDSRGADDMELSTLRVWLYT